MNMAMRIGFPGNKKVAAEFDGFTVLTDQPKEAGGDGAAPAPFSLFLASIGTCAGIFVLSFCRKRDIPTEGLEIVQTEEWDDTEHRVSKITLEIVLPKNFPEKYRDSLVQTANLCTVKKHLFQPPIFKVLTTCRPGN
ncbi:MAG: OsmC family protein [Elusimicrobia bacterium]|nr:OsmC family protein [Elusimicrobiota bacterium]